MTASRTAALVCALLPAVFVGPAFAQSRLRSASAPAREGRKGITIDQPFDAARITQRAEEAYVARLFLPAEISADPAVPRPLLVYLHGVNTDHQPFRFAGHGGEPDVREIVARLVREGVLPPLVVAAPSTVVSSDYPLSLWPAFDLDRLVHDAARTLRGKAAIDLDRVVVMGHSGAACNPRGGVFSAARETTLALRGLLLVDTCLDVPSAPLLVELPASVSVVVTYQTRSWPRAFEGFGQAFMAPRGTRSRAETVFDQRSPAGGHVHNAMVEDALRFYLPRVLAAR